MSKGSDRRPGNGFEDKYSAIFGEKPIKRGSYVQDPKTGKLVPRGTYERAEVNAPAVHGDVADFVSPISRELITDRAQLRRHNEKHGVTNTADFSSAYIAERARKRQSESLGTTAQAKKERMNLIRSELDKRGL